MEPLDCNHVYFVMLTSQEKAGKMSDFGNDEYLEMVCVEAGYIGDAIAVGQEPYVGKMTLSWQSLE